MLKIIIMNKLRKFIIKLFKFNKHTQEKPRNLMEAISMNGVSMKKMNKNKII